MVVEVAMRRMTTIGLLVMMGCGDAAQEGMAGGSGGDPGAGGMGGVAGQGGAGGEAVSDYGELADCNVSRETSGPYETTRQYTYREWEVIETAEPVTVTVCGDYSIFEGVRTLHFPECITSVMYPEDGVVEVLCREIITHPIGGFNGYGWEQVYVKR